MLKSSVVHIVTQVACVRRASDRLKTDVESVLMMRRKVLSSLLGLDY